MTTRTLADLSNEELTQLSQAHDSGQYTDKDKALISTLDNNTLQQLSAQHSQASSIPINDKSTFMKGVDYVNATGSGLREGTMDAVKSMGQLASSIIKNTIGRVTPDSVNKIAQDTANTISNKYNQFSNYINSNPIDQEAQQLHPVTAAIAKGTGNVLGLTALGTPLFKPLNSVTESGLSALAPSLVSSPITRGAISQGIQGGVIGAASNPNNPLQGALSAATLTAPLGAIGSAVGAKLQRSGDIVDYETNNLINAGVKPGSIEGYNRIKNAVKNNGVDYSKIQVQKIIDEKVDNLIQDINPATNLEQVPSKTIAQLAQTKFTDVADKVQQGFKPLREAPQVFDTPLLKQTLANTSQDLTIPLPKQNMPIKPTINDMWTYRERLDDVIQAARARAVTGNVLKQDIVPLGAVRKALTDDMMNAASSINLKDQFLNTEAIYQNEYLPFKAFNTESGKMISPDDVTDAMKEVNSLINPRLTVDFSRLQKIAKSLGPTGNEIVGQAMLENLYNRSLSDKGLVTPKTFYTGLKKYNATGISSEIWGPKTIQAAKGLGKIIDGADEAMRQGTLTDATSFYNKLPSLLGSRPGIQMLQWLGTSNPNRALIRKTLQNVITGVVAIGAAKQPTK